MKKNLQGFFFFCYEIFLFIKLILFVLFCFVFIDSTMITSCVVLQFDDLLSIFNDAQLKSALDTYKEITELMKQASEQRKVSAGNKLTVCTFNEYFENTFLRPSSPLKIDYFGKTIKNEFLL